MEEKRTIRVSEHSNKALNQPFLRPIFDKLFHVIYTDNNPDYVFDILDLSSSHGITDVFRFPNAVRVFFNTENIKPDYNTYDYVISFFPGIEYNGRYMYVPVRVLVPSRDDWYGLALRKHIGAEQALSEKESFCTFCYSNRWGNPKREELFFELSKYKKVESGGFFHNNIGGAVEDKLSFTRRGKFTIAAENSMYYITEKIWDAFAAQTIPIFWGDPLIDSYGIFNPRSFVNVHDFPTIRDVVDRIVRIDNDDELYLSMLREPALIDSKSREEWIADVEKYLLKIVRHHQYV